MSKEKVYLSIILYSFNNARSIGRKLTWLHEVASADFENFDITIVDDFSTDDSVKEIYRACENLESSVSLIQMAWHHGIELSMFAAAESVVGDFIVEIDDMDDCLPDDIFIRMYRRSNEAMADIITASSTSKSRITSRLFYFLMNRLSKFDLQTENVRMVTRRALNRILNEKNKFRYRQIFYKLSGYSYASITYAHIPSRPKNKNYREERLRKGMETLILFSDIGTKIGVFFSVVLLSLSLGLGVYALIVKLVRKDVASGWTTLMLFLSVGFAGVFVLMSIVCKYLSLLLPEVQQTRIYTYKSIEKVVGKK